MFASRSQKRAACQPTLPDEVTAVFAAVAMKVGGRLVLSFAKTGSGMVETQ